MTNLRHSPNLPGDGRRRTYVISADAATLAREYFHAEVVASVVTGQANRAAIYSRHLVRMCRRVKK
jgi:hypothetical protein